MEVGPHTLPDDTVPRELAFLYPRNPDPYDLTDESERSFFMLPRGSDVPPKYPDKAPPPTAYDIVVRFLVKRGQPELLSILAFVSRDWCGAVRKLRFHRLHLEPGLNFPRLLEVFRPDTVLPYLRQLHLNGRLRTWPIEARDADHLWLPQLVPLFADILAVSTVDYVFLQLLSWGNVPGEIRAVLLALPGVRALGIHDVDFWNTNQFLRLLNAHAPRLQFLQIWHAFYWAFNHVPSQLVRTEPLLLTELTLGCAYTPLIMEWLLGAGSREMLAIEELSVASRDVYRDDARLARVVKKIGPWMKRFTYNEWGGRPGMCEGDHTGDEKADSDEEMEVDGDDDDDDDEDYVDEDDDMEDDTSDTDGDEDSEMDEEPNELVGADEDPALVLENNADLTVARQPRMREVAPVCLLPDDEEHNRMEDADTEFKNPPFTREGSDLGQAAFEQELKAITNHHSRMEMPMMESFDGRIYWKSSFSLLTLAMLCRPVYSSEEFYRFDLEINFESVDVFNDAPWRDIDRLLRGVTIPEPDDSDEEDEGAKIDLRVTIAVKGWDVGMKQDSDSERLNEVKRKLPRTVKKNSLHIYVKAWLRRPPRDGPPDWMATYYF